MTYTFDPSLGDDTSLVRFHIGDNHDEGHFMEDETIEYLISTFSVGQAVVKSIEYIISQLSSPDFSMGWMNVNKAQARAGYERLLTLKAQEFNLNPSNVRASSSVKLPWRADSLMTDGTQDGS